MVLTLLALTVPFRVAVVVPTPEAALVVALGPLPVVKVLSSPIFY